MFAVKGWSVDNSTLKPQLEVISRRAESKDASTANDGASRKRKRKRNEAPTSQNDDVDVGKLWEQHIEGKDPAKAKKKLLQAKKRQKTDDTEAPGSKHHGKESAREHLAKLKEKKKKKKDASAGGEPSAIDAATSSAVTASVIVKSAPPVPHLPTTAKLTPMQAAMRQKLVSARFRHLNETLYTAPSKTALELFDQNPEMFEDYHSGFRQQVEIWPENPLDDFVAIVQARGKVKPVRLTEKNRKGRPSDAGAEEDSSKPVVLPRTHGTAIIADLGCGDARLAQTLTDNDCINTLNLKIHSFDLHSPSPLVTKADIAHLPLEDGSVDVAVFCLALMGTNWISFIEEAYRVLHWKGELWVAEIKSRFGRVDGKGGKGGGKVVEHSVGSKRKAAVMKKAAEVKQKGDVELNEQVALRTEVDGVETKVVETDVSAFVEVLKRRGFVLKDGDQSIDLRNKMFVKMEFIKAAAPTKGKGVVATTQKPAVAKFAKKKFVDEERDEVDSGDEAKVLKPCLYKVR
ncbi:hypothetical protein LTR62_004807 [Meristemomyces frigidus]|uniref:Ribosomal RNA-processing protein 8 n=1 Tax=Meristemomyces frigidus TaxID=1508187 RepID=A0AAN7YR83_9PEZI|nr:hypothetical protein LTR62_004807 [Meristemomyces frigidus]